MIDVKTQAVITVRKDDKVHAYHCPNNSNLGEIYDALNEMRSYIVQKIQEIERSQKPAEQTKVESIDD